MQFVVYGRDGADAEALNRRMAAREAHLAGCATLKENGHLIYAVALVDDSDKMIGSMMVMEFATRNELDEWLKQEPYVKGKVWDKIEITAGKVSALFAKQAASQSREQVIH
ncbi:MAG: hypothetical protein IAF58_10485 [Leptolyngbya sp.]|nr:hypothetical protein [Candidatus Melainabacteria bacterium]